MATSLTLVGCQKDRAADLSKYDAVVPVEVLHAKVTRVQKRQNDVVLIQLGIGEADGALVNMRFEVVRFGETLGELIVTKVGTDFSTARLLQGGRSEIIVGDQARTRKRLEPLTNTGNRKDK